MIKRIALSLAASALAATAVVGASGPANAAPTSQAVDVPTAMIYHGLSWE